MMRSPVPWLPAAASSAVALIVAATCSPMLDWPLQTYTEPKTTSERVSLCAPAATVSVRGVSEAG